MAFAEFLQQERADPLIPVGTPEPLVTVRADHGYIVSVEPDDRGVERAATEVEHEDVPHVRTALVILVREGGGDRFRQDIQDGQRRRSRPARRVASRAATPKYAGMVITTLRTVSSSAADTLRASSRIMKAEIISGVYFCLW